MDKVNAKQLINWGNCTCNILDERDPDMLVLFQNNCWNKAMWSKHFLILYFPYSTDIQALNDSDLMRGTKDEIDGRSPVWERCLSGQPHVWLVFYKGTRTHWDPYRLYGRGAPVSYYSLFYGPNICSRARLAQYTQRCRLDNFIHSHLPAAQLLCLFKKPCNLRIPYTPVMSERFDKEDTAHPNHWNTLSVERNEVKVPRLYASWWLLTQGINYKLLVIIYIFLVFLMYRNAAFQTLTSTETFYVV